jgi:hypothetical protein
VIFCWWKLATEPYPKRVQSSSYHNIFLKGPFLSYVPYFVWKDRFIASPCWHVSMCLSRQISFDPVDAVLQHLPLETSYFLFNFLPSIIAMWWLCELQRWRWLLVTLNVFFWNV